MVAPGQGNAWADWSRLVATVRFDLDAGDFVFFGFSPYHDKVGSERLPWRKSTRKPKLLIIDELAFPLFERRSDRRFFQVAARRYGGSLLITTDQVVTQWGTAW